MNAEENNIEHLVLVVEIAVDDSSQDLEVLNRKFTESSSNIILTPLGSHADDDIIIAHSESLTLQQLVQYEKTECNPSFIALPIPLQVLTVFDEMCSHFYENPLIKHNNVFQYINKGNTNSINNILNRIHSSLTQLQLFGFLRSKSGVDDNYVNDSNSLNLLLFKVPRFESSDDDADTKLENDEILYAIIQEINGEPIHMAPTSVIQAILLSGIKFRAKVDVDTKHNMRITEMPLCPVCRFRIEPSVLKLPSPKIHRRCSRRQNDHCENMPFLAPWEYPNICVACILLHEYLQLSGARPFAYSHYNRRSNQNVQERLRCYDCSMEETLWVCLTCGIVGCGRYSQGHAENHYKESSHPISLELASQRIWDYKSGSFVHRDDILNCPFMKSLLGSVHRGLQQEPSCDTRSHIESGMQYTAKKSHVIGEEYEALLESALEDQAQYFEGEICRLRSTLAAELMMDQDLSDEQRKELESLTSNIESLRIEVSILGKNLIDAQAEENDHRMIANSLLREQAANKTLLDQMKSDIRQEVMLYHAQVEDLQLQISDLEANLSMRQQIAQSQDLSQAQIIGTSSERMKAVRKATRKTARK